MIQTKKVLSSKYQEKITLRKFYFNKYLEDLILGNCKKDYKHKYLHLCPWKADTSHLCLMSPN